MDQLLKQMLDFNRTAFENTFNAVTMLQDQSERAASACFDQAPWLPKEGKTVIGEWTNACKRGRETFKSCVDDGFQKAEAFLSELSKDS